MKAWIRSGFCGMLVFHLARGQNSMEELCSMINGFPLPAGVSQIGYDRTEGKCEYRYQFGIAPDEILKFYEEKLPKNGWKVMSSSNHRVGFAAGGEIKAYKGGVQVTISATEAFMAKILEISFANYGGEIAKQGETPSQDFSKELEDVVKQLPVPEGAGFTGKSINNQKVEYTYSYGGEIPKALKWIEGKLKEKGWKITKYEVNQMGGVEGGTIEASKGKYNLEVIGAFVFMIKTITYRVSYAE